MHEIRAEASAPPGPSRARHGPDAQRRSIASASTFFSRGGPPRKSAFYSEAPAIKRRPGRGASASS